MQHFRFFRYMAVVVMVFFIIISIFDIKRAGPKAREEKVNYYQKEFKGIILQKSVNRGMRIQIDNNGKKEKQYLYEAKNFDLTPVDLYDFIQVSDSIIKLPNSYDLYIYRNNEKYYFKLGEYINK